MNSVKYSKITINGGKMSKNFFYLFLVILLLFVQESIAQQTCKVIKDYGDGSYSVRIGTNTLLAISDTMQKEMFKKNNDLLALRKKLAIKEELLGKHDILKAQYEVTLTHQKEYITELESVLKGYKGILHDYKKLKEPWLTVNSGVGVTGNSTKPALMFGLGIRNIRIWAFLQENNSGTLAGLVFPLF